MNLTIQSVTPPHRATLFAGHDYWLFSVKVALSGSPGDGNLSIAFGADANGTLFAGSYPVPKVPDGTYDVAASIAVQIPSFFFHIGTAPGVYKVRAAYTEYLPAPSGGRSGVNVVTTYSDPVDITLV